MNLIATSALKKTDLPRPYAKWETISRFALTFDIVVEYGSTDFLSEKNLFDPLETDPMKIRKFLFVTQRIQNHQHAEPSAEEMKAIWTAIERLRTIVPA